jgi:hypothetical protein
MTRLRKLMLEELRRRNFSSETIRGYPGVGDRFANYASLYVHNLRACAWEQREIVAARPTQFLPRRTQHK